MNEVEYNVQLRSVMNLAALVRGLKLRELYQAIDRAETMGPILDPTLYIQAGNNLRWQKRLVAAAARFQDDALAIKTEIDQAEQAAQEE